jgi:hypothetical protein
VYLNLIILPKSDLVIHFLLGYRLRDVFVSLDDTNTDFPVECGQFKGPGINAEVVHIVCHNNARGRYVKTEIKGPRSEKVLTLCEIRVLISP